MMFSEVSQQYIDHKTIINVPNGKVRYVSPRTLDDYAQFRKALNIFFGSLPLGEIKPAAMACYQQLRATGGDGNGTSWAQPAGANLIIKELGFLIRLMKLAGAWTAEHEAQFCHLQHVESDIGYALTPEEQEHWLTTAQKESQFIFCYSLLAIHTMLRTNELRALRFRDVNVYSRIVEVRQASSKTRGSTRTVPLETEESVWAVERLMERAKTCGAFQPQHFIFPFRIAPETYNPDRGMTVSAIKKPWRHVCEKTKITWRPSDTRHTGCTRMAEAGQPIHVIMAVAGHMNLKMQMHYIHISEMSKRAGIRLAFEKKKPMKSVDKATVNSKCLKTGQI